MQEKITYTDEVVDSYSGQLNKEAGIYINGEIVGVVEYVLYDNELTVSDIFIRPEFRRRGYASRLMKYIKIENPDHVYHSSFKTVDGASFIHKDLSLAENVNFERGKDPKEAMDIGISRELKERLFTTGSPYYHNIATRLRIFSLFGKIPYPEIYYLTEDHKALEKRPIKLLELMKLSDPYKATVNFDNIDFWETKHGKLLSVGEGWGSVLYGDKDMALYYIGNKS